MKTSANSAEQESKSLLHFCTEFESDKAHWASRFTKVLELNSASKKSWRLENRNLRRIHFSLTYATPLLPAPTLSEVSAG